MSLHDDRVHDARNADQARKLDSCEPAQGSDTLNGTLLNCAYCGGASQGNYTIHRDAFAEGPEVSLCDACGDTEQDGPGVAAIWARIGQAAVCLDCQEEIRPGDERRGSFHGWCSVVRDRELP
jgi:hypothetical protein